MSPTQIADAYLAKRRQTDAIFAALCLRKPEILRRDPGEWGKHVGLWLGQIGSSTVTPRRVDLWLAAANVGGWNRNCELKLWQRESLAAVLESWARSHA